MECQESPALILRRELRARVENHVEHRHMRAETDIRDDGLLHQVRTLALVARVLVGAEVGVGPTVEAALNDVREVVGDQIVAQRVALLRGRPQGIRARDTSAARSRCACRRHRFHGRCHRDCSG